MFNFILGVVAGGVFFGAESILEYGLGISLFACIVGARLYFGSPSIRQPLQQRRPTFGSIFAEMGENKLASASVDRGVPETGSVPMPMIHTKRPTKL